MSQRTLHWPRRIARTQRQPLATGHGSFLLQRIHLGDDAFDGQRVQLGGYLLVLAREGSVILDGDHCSLLLQEGDAALIPPSRFRVTEIPRPRFTRGETMYWFFNQRTLADLVTGRDSLDEMAARIALPTLPFYPARRVAAAINAAMGAKILTAPTDLRRVFTLLLNACPAMAGTFLKHAYFVPRFKLCLFLEEQCLGKVDASAVAERYPAGVRVFRRDCMNYLGLPVEQWLFRRRIELAQAWLRYSTLTDQEVATRLDYDDLRQFRGDMKRWGRFSPLELAALRLLSPVKANRKTDFPFWFPNGEVRAAKERRSSSDYSTLAMEAPTRTAQRALLRKYSQSELPSLSAPGEMYPLINRPSGAEDPVLEEQESKPENVIALEAVEKWQAGGFSLSGHVSAFAIAA